MTRHSQRIWDKVLLYGNEKRRAAQALWEHPAFPQLYPELLLTLHTTIRASVPLMQQAAEACEALPGDGVAAGFGAYLREHLEEEKDHEWWVVEDLEKLGVPRERTLGQIPGPHAAAVVGAQYYWVRHAHPIALLGYLAVLEWEFPDPASFGPIAERSSLPPEAFRTFRSHAQLDKLHRADMEAVVDALPLTEAHHTLVGLSVLATSQNIATLYRGLVAAQEARVMLQRA